MEVTGRVLGCAVRPPGHDRGVGQQQRGDEGLAFLGEFTVPAQHDDLATLRRPRRPGSGRPDGWALEPAREHDDPAGVFPAGLVGRLDRFFLQPGLGDDHQGQDRPRAITPPCARRDWIFLETLEVVVLGRSTIMAFSRCVRRGLAAHQQRPGPSCRARTARAGRAGRPSTSRTGPGCSRTAPPPGGGETAAARPGARPGSAARRLRGWIR